MAPSCRRRPGAATRAIGLLLAAGCSQACVSGHLIDHARRDERPVRIDAVASDGRQLHVEYLASVTNEWGDRVGSRRRAARVPLAPLTPPGSVAADAIPVRWVAAREPVEERWKALPLRPPARTASANGSGSGVAVAARDGGGNGHRSPNGNGNGHVSSGPRPASYAPAPGAPPQAWLVESEDGRLLGIALAPGPGAPEGAQLPAGALTRTGTASWVWPLVPLAGAFDVLAAPVLVFFAVPMVVLGD